MMRAWKKTTAGVLLAVLMACTITPVVTVAASEGAVFTDAEGSFAESGVYDAANLLTAEEAAGLAEQITALKEKTDWDIFAVTTANAEGKSSMAYADDFYDARTEEDSDGVLVLIDMDNREIYLSTSGIASRYLTDERIEWILDDGYFYVSEGWYADCFSAMLDGVEEYYDDGIYEDQYNYDTETGAISRYLTITFGEALFAFIIAAAGGLITYFSVTKGYSIKGKTYDYPYMKYSKLDLLDHEDRFVNKVVTHQRIQTNTGNGGGHRSSSVGHRSSTHRSSSGRSHGGGGRKF